ncbi:MAG: hypothetical protein ABI036_15590 [Fibrobacteria bacterium]
MGQYASLLLGAVLSVTAPRIGATDTVWAQAEPIWPWEETGRLWLAYASLEHVPGENGGWPKTMAGICSALERIASAAQSPDQAGRAAHTEGRPLAAALNALCLEKTRGRPAVTTLDLGAYPRERSYPLGHAFETFASGWGSIRVDPERAAVWQEMPSALKEDLSYPVSDHSYLHVRIGLRRDLAAWHQDPLGLDLPLSSKEVDLNEPALGYFHAENERFAFTVGRFQVHWSPSPDFGLALSRSVPYHNAAEFALKMPRMRYRFLASSLNPWLEGTPMGDSSGEDYPPGSEAYRQRHYASANGAVNFHKRVYAENIKTLFAHRLEGELGPLGLGITEVEIIGGKIPDLRDAGPFVTFHNDFKDGYTNGALSFDATCKLPAGLSLGAELYLDDVQYSQTEGTGNTASLLGYLAVLRHAFQMRGWACSQSLNIVRTDPFLYGYLQPLNSMASRQILASNFEVGDSAYVDKYVVDYPIGYLRGGDAFDFWYRMEAWNGFKTRLSLSAAVLAKGDVDLYTPYEDYFASPHDSPSGTAEREFRLRMEGEYRWRRNTSFHAGAGWQSVWSPERLGGGHADHFQGSLGIAWSLPR